MIGRVITVNGYVCSPIGSMIIEQGKSIILQFDLASGIHYLLAY